MRSNLVGKAWRAVWNMKKSLPLTLHLMKDSRVGRQYKIAFIFVTVGYLLFPYDFIFDFPFFGQLDDLAILLYMLNWFIQHTPKEILTEYGWKEGDVVGKKNKKKEKEKAKAKQPQKRAMLAARKVDQDASEKPAAKKMRRLRSREAEA